jgi:hypothetical protein
MQQQGQTQPVTVPLALMQSEACTQVGDPTTSDLLRQSEMTAAEAAQPEEMGEKWQQMGEEDTWELEDVELPEHVRNTLSHQEQLQLRVKRMHKQRLDVLSRQEQQRIRQQRGGLAPLLQRTHSQHQPQQQVQQSPQQQIQQQQQKRPQQIEGQNVVQKQPQPSPCPSAPYAPKVDEAYLKVSCSWKRWFKMWNVEIASCGVNKKQGTGLVKL